MWVYYDMKNALSTYIEKYLFIRLFFNLLNTFFVYTVGVRVPSLSRIVNG